MTNTEAFAEYRAAKAAAGTDKLALRKATRLRDAIMKDNDGLVFRVAKRLLGARRWANTAMQEDALQEGRIGLMRAIEEFDASRGSAFSTVAALWIRHHVQNCMHHQVDFAKQRSACMPPRAAREVAKFRTINGREPEPHEIQFEHKGQRITPTREQWDKWLDATLVVSVEDMGGGEDDSRPSDELVADERTNPDAVVASTHLGNRLTAELDAMSPRNRDMAKALFIEGKPIPQVAQQFGLGVDRIHQLKAVLEKRLRHALASP